MLLLEEPLRGRVVATAVKHPRLPDGRGPLGNAEVVARCSPRGPRGARTLEEIEQMAEALGETLGVRERHWAHLVGSPPDPREEDTVGLSAAALEEALGRAGLRLSELSAIVAATSTPARATGANGPAIAARLGGRCAAFDVRSGCSGGLWALVQGHLLAQASGRPVAVVAADTFSKLVPPDRPLAALAFGDAAAAAVVVPDERAGVLACAFDSDGEAWALAGAPAPFPPTREALEQGLYRLTGDPDALAERAPGLYAEVLAAARRAAGSPPEDLLVPHQTSLPAVESLAKVAGVPMARCVVTVARHANCGAPGVLIALDEALRSERLLGGRVASLAALGGGLAWGAALLRA